MVRGGQGAALTAVLKPDTCGRIHDHLMIQLSSLATGTPHCRLSKLKPAAYRLKEEKRK